MVVSRFPRQRGFSCRNVLQGLPPLASSASSRCRIRFSVVSSESTAFTGSRRPDRSTHCPRHVDDHGRHEVRPSLLDRVRGLRRKPLGELIARTAVSRHLPGHDGGLGLADRLGLGSLGLADCPGLVRLGLAEGSCVFWAFWSSAPATSFICSALAAAMVLIFFASCSAFWPRPRPCWSRPESRDLRGR